MAPLAAIGAIGAPLVHHDAPLSQIHFFEKHHWRILAPLASFEWRQLRHAWRHSWNIICTPFSLAPMALSSLAPSPMAAIKKPSSFVVRNNWQFNFIWQSAIYICYASLFKLSVWFCGSVLIFMTITVLIFSPPKPLKIDKKAVHFFQKIVFFSQNASNFIKWTIPAVFFYEGVR